MKEYEIVKEVFNPCAGDQRPDTCEIIEKEVENPEAFVKEQYRQESHVEFLHFITRQHCRSPEGRERIRG